MIRRTSRPGLTLTEALVALFVMALGLLSLLTLFPLGAFQMAQALKDDRTAQTAIQADGYMRMYWQQHVVEGNTERTGISEAMLNPGVIGPITITTMPPLGGTITAASTASPIVITSTGHGIPSGPPVQVTVTGVGGITGANGSWPASVSSVDNFQLTGSTGAGTYTTNTGRWYRSDKAGEPSYALFVDPLGWQARSSMLGERPWISRSQSSVGGAATAVPPRRTLAAVGNPIQTCCLVDDLGFRENGSPGATVDWGQDYNWSAVIQQPRVDTPNVANLKILVYYKRPALTGETRTELLVNPGTVTPNVTTSLTFTIADYDDKTTYVRKGGWIMDGTINPALGIRNANFYRIAGVTASGGGTFTIDLETPIRPLWNGSAAAYTGQFYLFANLAEVFERPQLRPTSYEP